MNLMSTVVLDARPKAAHIPTCPPSKEGEKLVRDSLAFLVAKHAFYAHPIYNEMRIAYTDHPMIPYAATDARTLFYNPWSLIRTGFDIHSMAFLHAHEVSHWLFGHLLLAQKFELENSVFTGSRVLPYLPQLMNAAEDYVINAQLVEGKVGRMPTEPDPMKSGQRIQLGLFDKLISEKGMEASVAVYDKIFPRGGGSGGYGGTGEPGGGSLDVHLRADKRQQKQEDSGAKIQAIAAAIEAARAANQMGSLPGAIQRMVTDLLDPKVKWQDKLKATMMRAAGDPSYDWRYLDKRLIIRPDPMYFARQSHSGAGIIVIGIDTSGSIGNPQLTRFFAEASSIVEELHPAELHVMWCDAAVHRHDELDEPEDLVEYHEVIKSEGAGGGGGTSFRPVFEKVAELNMQPDMLVYLTDLAGSFPDHEPDYPVIWGTIVPGSKAPFGEVIDVEL